MNIVIIPARGGSKRIPRKNIKDFCGKPMLAYPIQAALQSGIIDKVVVSTDDQEIAAIAQQYGAEVPFLREPELADDYTGTTAVIRDAILRLQQLGWSLDSCACLYATTPLLNANLIRALQQELITTNADYVFTAARFSFPIQRALVLTETGGIIPFDSTSIGKRSQDLQPTFHDAGQLYWAKAATWLDLSKSVFGTHSRLFELPSHLVQDIDTPDDWRRAEYLYRLLQQESA
ncbi:pseudaminic acid cytidylyltransferase [Alishewanella longhuensis]|uniref:Pseudaminic acid cytidylyltransferase n=1 Tax=Alishewanella longhuensis TaxID=1091037 RepID=A0ABQ3KYJ4_9ALTE|nr:pseudaminic acid cytidylyltransferase [Alishewanella longhuensis]GHG69417.1 pseudaminic acid cytidylyltransferase [Alishewanella longhuensis]